MFVVNDSADRQARPLLPVGLMQTLELVSGADVISAAESSAVPTAAADAAHPDWASVERRTSGC